MPPYNPDITETEDGKNGLFSFFKTHYSFEGRHDTEIVHVFTRRHWWVLLGPCVGAFFLALLPIFLIILGAKFLVGNQLVIVYFSLAWILYIMCIWFWLFYTLTMHALDVWIVTNERIIDSVQLGLFRRKVSELRLEVIQDVSVNTTGIIQSYFNFGDIEVQTGGAELRFLFEKIPKPLEVKDKIMQAVEVEENERFHPPHP